MHIARLEAAGLYGRFDVDLNFDSGLNILYGRNGAGKTTVLHILTNMLNRDYSRFAFLNFGTIKLTFQDGLFVQLRRLVSDAESVIELERSDDEEIVEIPIKQVRTSEPTSVESLAKYLANAPDGRSASYFPAFRSIIETATSFDDQRVTFETARMLRASKNGYTAKDVAATHIARELFGSFIPTVSFPSPNEIEERLTADHRSGLLSLGLKDRELLNKFSVDVLTSLLSHHEATSPQTTQEHIDAIRQLLQALSRNQYEAHADSADTSWLSLKEVLDQSTSQELNSTYAPVLHVYKNILEDRVKEQRAAFSDLDSYLESINEIFEDKEIIIKPSLARVRSTVRIRFPDGSTVGGLKALSSGERQIVSLIYALSHMTSEDIVLVDEPEISLHVDWQRLLLSSIINRLGHRQVIIATHSPVMASGFEESMEEVRFTSGLAVDEDETPGAEFEG